MAGWRIPYENLSDPGQLKALLDAVLVIESDLDLTSLLRRIVTVATDVAGARYGALGVLDEDRVGLSEFVYAGIDPATADRIGHLPEGRGVLGLLIIEPRPIRIRDVATHPDSGGFPKGHPPMRSFLGVPIWVRGAVYGNLYLTEKRDAEEFSEVDEELVSVLARAAGLAIEKARLHTQLSELTLAEDRERIARDLHDTVIQRVFAVGLSLQALVRRAQDPELAERLQTAIADLDETIRQVRTTIFALEPLPSAEGGLRAEALEVCTQAVRSLGFNPEVRFEGALDTLPRNIASEALATLREALSNVARHARAHRVEVVLSATATAVSLAVLDDGVGLPRDLANTGAESVDGGRGLANMRERAQALGGSFSAGPRSGGGTQLDWRAPV
ncbi:MAG: GAF domain-containing sensor histidine kinase [Acidimicrobiaceae bacterium]|nr:GAF domain-containing sensor histidine kinase [Acidimicrobiaceae bacterium]